MPTKLFSILVPVTLFLMSCSLNKASNDHFEVKTNVSEPSKVRFAGKGAGAGMMLMSSMGPMGIAIGVAIDEGIANDIDKTAKMSGFDIETSVLQTLSSTLKAKAQKNAFKVQSVNEIIIEISRYGFVIQPGEDDLVTAQLHLNISLDDQEWLKIKYPEQLTEQQRKDIKTETLELVKVDGQVIESLFHHALHKVNNIINETSKELNDTKTL